MPATLVFDVNETLLDLGILAPDFKEIFGDERVLDLWFHQVIQYAMGLTLSGVYKPFGEIALGVMHMMAEADGVELTNAHARRIAGKIRSLPPHPDVPPALALLKDAGFRLVALTNNPLAVVDAQMASSGLRHFFEGIFSVETVQRFKPAPEPYRMVAGEFGLEPRQLWMIAAHAWDVGGAAHVGYRTAFVARRGKAPYPLFPKPDVIGNTLLDVAEGIVAMERS